MEQYFLVIPIFRNFWTTSRGRPKILKWNSEKFSFHLLPPTGLSEKFGQMESDFKRPGTSTLFGYSRNFPREISVPFASVFRKFCSNGKRQGLLLIFYACSRLTGFTIRSRDLCNSSAMLHELSYEATHWRPGFFVGSISPMEEKLKEGLFCGVYQSHEGIVKGRVILWCLSVPWKNRWQNKELICMTERNKYHVNGCFCPLHRLLVK